MGNAVNTSLYAALPPSMAPELPMEASRPLLFRRGERRAALIHDGNHYNETAAKNRGWLDSDPLWRHNSAH